MRAEPEFLRWEAVVRIHALSLKEWGGLDGVRDEGALQSAVASAEHTWFYGDGDIYDVAAAYAFHLAESQGFLDGNKRTAIACATTFLILNGCLDRANEDELYAAMIAIARREIDKSDLAILLRKQFPDG